MKKILYFIFVLVCTSCAWSTKEGYGLVKLDSEPKDCEFLYEIKSDFTGYSEQDAFDFVEKRIVEENAFGDTYYIVKQDVVENEDAIFGSKNTYKLKAKVYSCKH